MVWVSSRVHKYERLDNEGIQRVGADAADLHTLSSIPVVSVFYELTLKQQKYQNFPYKKAVQTWLR